MTTTCCAACHQQHDSCMLRCIERQRHVTLHETTTTCYAALRDNDMFRWIKRQRQVTLHCAIIMTCCSRLKNNDSDMVLHIRVRISVSIVVAKNITMLYSMTPIYETRRQKITKSCYIKCNFVQTLFLVSLDNVFCQFNSSEISPSSSIYVSTVQYTCLQCNICVCSAIYVSTVQYTCLQYNISLYSTI